MSLDFRATSLPGVYEIEPDVHADSRGSFTRLYCEKELRSVAPDLKICQSNLSNNHKKGTLRGLHFQKAPHEEEKILCCVRGAIWAVALDLRPGAIGRHHGTEISADNGRLLLLPKGTANGFQTLADDSVVLYFMASAYEPEAAAGYHHKSCGIEWPLPVGEISERDLAWPELRP